MLRGIRWPIAAGAAGPSPSEAPTIEAFIEAVVPEVRAAIDDVDRTLDCALTAAIALGSPEIGVPHGADARQDP
jgi:hypothetical protein